MKKLWDKFRRWLIRKLGGYDELPQPVVEQKPIEIHWEEWNTRPAPPIGRCGECKHSSYDEEYGNRWCNLNLGSRIVRENDYCNNFKPKENE